jgi:hypothetical protein
MSRGVDARCRDSGVPGMRNVLHPTRQQQVIAVSQLGWSGRRMEAAAGIRLVSTRYERGSILLTSNKHVRDWPEIFAGDEILTTAILDRLLHHVVVIHIDGQSYRLRELGALLSPTDPPSTPSPGWWLEAAGPPPVTDM